MITGIAPKLEKLISVLIHSRKDKSKLKDLIDLSEIDKFYTDFNAKCKKIKPLLSDDQIEEMFTGFIMAMYELKIKIYDAQYETEAPKQIARERIIEAEIGSSGPKDKGSRVVWTEALEKEVQALTLSLDKTFKMLGIAPITKPINLWSGTGKIQATKHGSLATEDPRGQLMDDMYSHVSSMLTPNAFKPIMGNQALDRLKAKLKITKTPATREKYQKQLENHLLAERDTAMMTAMWSAFSVIYVNNAKGDIRVYFPPGKISTQSIFWNFELNLIQKLGLIGEKTGRKIAYISLTADKNKELASLTAELENFKKIQPPTPISTKQITDTENSIKALLEDEANYEQRMLGGLEFTSGLKIDTLRKMGTHWREKAYKSDPSKPPKPQPLLMKTIEEAIDKKPKKPTTPVDKQEEEIMQDKPKSKGKGKKKT